MLTFLGYLVIGLARFLVRVRYSFEASRVGLGLGLPLLLLLLLMLIMTRVGNGEGGFVAGGGGLAGSEVVHLLRDISDLRGGVLMLM